MESIAYTSGFDGVEFGDWRSRVCVRVGGVRRRGLMAITASAGGGGGARYKGTVVKERKLAEMIEEKVAEARKVCEGNAASAECRVAWDEVEEVSQAKADFSRKLEKEDPLEYFCKENPEIDECRIVEV